MLKFAKWLLLFGLSIYAGICLLVYFNQEKLIFLPERLPKDFKFDFYGKFEETNYIMRDSVVLNGVLFKSKYSRGLIFYLHGNAGSIKNWGEVAETYTSLNYDVFIPDYRGYGKSGGQIQSQQQLFDDCQTLYNELRKRYAEDKIIILGYSIGTGIAAKLASTNNSQRLILQAPYYSLIDIMKQSYPILPRFLLKYKLQTNQYLKACKMPIVIFHGNADKLINYNASLRLKKELKPGDTLIILSGQDHNNITDNPEYTNAIKTILK